MTALGMLKKDEEIRAKDYEFNSLQDIVIPLIPTHQERDKIAGVLYLEEGKPKAKGRSYKCKKQFANEKDIKYYMIQQWQGFKPIDSPCLLSCCFYFPIPKSWSKKKSSLALHKESKPDLSNLVKQIEDCGNGILWKDDALIIGYFDSYKFYTDYEPCTIIRIKF